MRDSRTQILEKLRSFSNVVTDARAMDSTEQSFLFPSAGTDSRKELKRFERELTAISGEVRIVKSPNEMVAALVDVIKESGYRSVVLSSHPLLRETRLSERLTARLTTCSIINTAMYQDRKGIREQLAVTDVGITGADFLIADTGTVAMSSSPDEGRLVSLLPPTHVVVATAKQIVPTLSTALQSFKDKHRGDLPGACLTFITGPSRTADIEKQLVLGVHGPKRLIAFVIT